MDGESCLVKMTFAEGTYKLLCPDPRKGSLCSTVGYGEPEASARGAQRLMRPESVLIFRLAVPRLWYPKCVGKHLYGFSPVSSEITGPRTDIEKADHSHDVGIEYETPCFLRDSVSFLLSNALHVSGEGAGHPE